MSNRAHFKLEAPVLSLDLLIELDAGAAEETLLPRLKFVSFIKAKLLCEVAPHIVIFGDVLAIPASLGKVNQIVRSEIFQ